jgi:hypothetical protein
MPLNHRNAETGSLASYKFAIVHPKNENANVMIKKMKDKKN